MCDLEFIVDQVEPERFAAAPTLIFKLRIDQPAGALAIHAIALRCQIRIEPGRRRYSDQQKQNLLELFGKPSEWSRTVHPMLWTHASTIVTAFQGSTIAELPVPCTYDFNVAAMKYFYGLEDGDVPLSLLFSGSVFYDDPEFGLRVSPISWEKEARFRLPVRTWRHLMDTYYPNIAWLHLRRDVFDRLYEFKSREGIPTWEQALERLLAAEETPA